MQQDETVLPSIQRSITAVATARMNEGFPISTGWFYKCKETYLKYK